MFDEPRASVSQPVGQLELRERLRVNLRLAHAQLSRYGKLVEQVEAHASGEPGEGRVMMPADLANSKPGARCRAVRTVLFRRGDVV